MEIILLIAITIMMALTSVLVGILLGDIWLTMRNRRHRMTSTGIIPLTKLHVTVHMYGNTVEAAIPVTGDQPEDYSLACMALVHEIFSFTGVNILELHKDFAAIAANNPEPLVTGPYWWVEAAGIIISA